MITEKGSTKTVNLMTPGAEVLVLGHGNISLIVKMQSSLLPGIYQTNQVCSNDHQENVYQNYKFYDPWDRDSSGRAWPYKSYSKNALFLFKNLLLYSPRH